MFHILILQKQDVRILLAGLPPGQYVVEVWTEANVAIEKKLKVLLPRAFEATFALIVKIG